jgi:hypothetical protein
MGIGRAFELSIYGRLSVDGATNYLCVFGGGAGHGAELGCFGLVSPGILGLA